MKKKFAVIIAIMAIAAITTAVFASSSLQPKSADASDYVYPSGKPTVAVVTTPTGETPSAVNYDGVTDSPGSECFVLAPGATPIKGVRDIAVNSVGVGTALNKTDPGLPADWL